MTRLAAICSLIEKANVVADVGCDHGRVAEYVAANGLAKTTIASDISERCLDKARARLETFDNVKFYRCDGLDYECDEAIIAGMGGFTVIGILRRAKKLPDSLVICAHRDSDSVRRTLVELGYGIVADFMTEERGKFYTIMRAELGAKCAEPTELQYLFGVSYQTQSDVLRKYLIKLRNTYMRAADKNENKLAYVGAALKLQGVMPDTTK